MTIYTSGQVKDKVLRRELHHKFAGTGFIDEVLNLMPLKIENTLNNYKVSMLGKNPQDRGSYDPSHVLSTIAGGAKILVEDSQNLPPGWQDDDLCDLMTLTDPEMAGGDGTNDEVSI